MADKTLSRISVDFTRKLGRIKPMNAGNNGPKIPKDDQTSGNFDTFKMLRIPYARLHDANFCSAYGAPHTVDVRVGRDDNPEFSEISRFKLLLGTILPKPYLLGKIHC